MGLCRAGKCIASLRKSKHLTPKYYTWAASTKVKLLVFFHFMMEQATFRLKREVYYELFVSLFEPQSAERLVAWQWGGFLLPILCDRSDTLILNHTDPPLFQTLSFPSHSWSHMTNNTFLFNCHLKYSSPADVPLPQFVPLHADLYPLVFFHNWFCFHRAKKKRNHLTMHMNNTNITKIVITQMLP